VLRNPALRIAKPLPIISSAAWKKNNKRTFRYFFESKNLKLITEIELQQGIRNCAELKNIAKFAN